MNCSENMFEEIKYKGEVLGMIIRSSYRSDRMEFFSPENYSQQLGYMPHKKGHVISAHFHKVVDKSIKLTQEVLIIRSGSIRVNFYTVDKEYVDKRELFTGDILFLCSGGHGFEVLEDAEIVEVKQGPYSGKESDKVVFKGIEKNDTC